MSSGRKLNRDSLLRIEAEYQDFKVEKNIRSKLDKYYLDPAWQYLQRCKDNEIGDLNKKKVLDLGCGTGGAAIDALKNGAIVTAVDISPKSIEHLINRAREEGVEPFLSAYVMDAQSMTLDDSSFDVVIGNGILHHLPDLKESLIEIHRVLKPDGKAVFVEPLGMNPLLNLYRKMTPDMRTPDEQPLRMQELNTIKNIFPNASMQFFDLTTLLSKLLMAARLQSQAIKIQHKLIKLDNTLIRRKRRCRSNGVTFLQKMSWNVLIVLKK